MRIKLLRGVCIRGAGYQMGDVVEVDSATGAYLVGRGVGVEVGPESDESDGSDRSDGVVETATVQAAEQATGRRQRRKG